MGTPHVVVLLVLVLVLVVLIVVAKRVVSRAAPPHEHFDVNMTVAGAALDPAVASALAGADACVKGSSFPGLHKHPTAPTACYLDPAEMILTQNGGCASANQALSGVKGVTGVTIDHGISPLNDYCSITFDPKLSDADRLGAVNAIRDANALSIPTIVSLTSDRVMLQEKLTQTQALVQQQSDAWATEHAARLACDLARNVCETQRKSVPPAPAGPLPTSTDGQCGPTRGTRCPTGQCCSTSGWCGGPGSAHCTSAKRADTTYDGAR